MADTVGINVVFTDLVGSTEMASRLGPDATEELRLVHFGLLRGAMEAHGGREVKNLGDGLMVVFPSLGAALDGGVAMQQAIERHNATGKEPLGVRVGISTGDATEEDDDYFGEPVVEAARLCAKCDAGQIITTELISLLARKSDHVFQSIGELELRGVPEPVPSVQVSWEPMVIEAELPLPDRIRPDMDLAIAGRETETDLLAQSFKAVEAGDRRVTLLAGEPGIGKTRLASELAVLAHGRGAAVLYGRCDEELTVPYQPWVEALGHLLDHGPDDLVDEIVTAHGPELGTLVPQLRRSHPDLAPVPTSDPETERYQLFQAVTATVALVADRSPVLLVLDDLHWAGGLDLTLLRHVVTNLPAAAVMIVGTYRDSELSSEHPLVDTVATLRRESGTEAIKVSGLDDLGTLALVEASAGQQLTGAAREMAIALRQESAGNPFFAHEILRNLVESGLIYQDEDGEWIIAAETLEDLAIPQSVRDVVGQRISRLGDDTRKTLTAAAVIGAEFGLAVLAEVTGSDEDDLLDLLEVVVDAGILVEVPGGDEQFRFQHTAARTTLVADLSDGRRRRLHRKVAEALEAAFGAEPGDRIGELATHWIAATAPVDGAKAIHYARLAGQRAEAALAPDEAVRWFTTALEHIALVADPDQRVRAELLIELGTAQKNSGDPTYRETLLEASAAAGDLGDAELMAAAALANSRGFISKLGARDDERIAALEAAIDAVGPAPSAHRARLLATLSGELEYSSTLDERRAFIDEALAIARDLGDPATLATVQNRFCMSFAIPHTLEARREASASSREIADQLGDSSIGFWADCGAFQAAFAAGAAEEAREALDRLLSEAEEIGRPSFRWIAGCLRGVMVAVEGDTEAMELLGVENLDLGTEAGEPDAFDYYGAALMPARWMQGRGMEIIDLVRQAAADNPKVEAFAAIPAEFLAESGDLEAARKLMDEVPPPDFVFPVNNNWTTAIGIWAMVAHNLGDEQAARTLYDHLAPWTGQVASNRANCLSTVDGMLARLAATFGDHEAAEAHFEAAAELNAAFGANYFAATDDLARAQLHAEIGGPDGTERATEYADRAAETAEAHGYVDVARRAAAVLAGLARG